MSKHTLSVKAVIFDMDGVITNTMPDHYEAWRVILAKEGLEVVHYDIYSREGQRGIHSVAEIFEHHKKPFDIKHAPRILKAKEEYFKQIARVRFISGTRNFLKDLKRRQFRLALVTGTAKHELHKILPDHLYKLFEVIVTGNDVTNGKPHPEPFLRAIKLLKIRPQEGVVIENAPFGIQSAKLAGLTCIALETSLPKKYLSKADFIFKSINNLKQKINFRLPNEI
jgi:beta-phosphoglucomutase